MKVKTIRTATDKEQKQMGISKDTNFHETISLPFPEESINDLAMKAWELGFVGMTLKVKEGDMFSDGPKKIKKYETDFMTVEFYETT